MSKNKKYYLEVNTLAFLLTVYCYYKMNKNEEHNSFYNYPIKTTVNWTPMTLASFMLLLTSTTSLILALNPDRSNFHESNFQKTLNKIAASTPGVLSLATDAGFKIAKLIGGDRSEAIEGVAIEAISLTEQAMRFLLTIEQIHAHELARSIRIENSQDNSAANGLYLTRSGYIAHQVDRAFILTVESAVQYAWRSGVYKFLTHYLNIQENDTLKALASLYLVADITKWIGTNSINNVALAAEIVIYGEDKSLYYKIEEPKFIQKIKDFTNLIAEGIKKAKEDIIELERKFLAEAKEVENKIAEAMQLREIAEAANEAKSEILKQLNNAQADLTKLGTQLAIKTQELEEKIEEALHLKQLFEAGEKAKEQLSKELEKFNHYFGKQIAELDKHALNIQAHWHGFKARQQPEVKEFILKKKTAIEDKAINDPEHTEIQGSVVDTISLTTLGHQVDKKKQTKPEEHHRYSIFGNIFSHKEDDHEGAKSDHIEGFFSRILHPHHQASPNPKATKTDKKTEKKASSSSSSSSTQQSKTAALAKTDKANLNEKSNDIYITLVAKKMTELILLLSTSKSMLKAPKNIEQKEYELAKKEAEENTNKTVAIKYEGFRVIEMPENKTVFQKAGNDLLDTTLTLRMMTEVSAEFIGEEGGFHHFNEIAAFAI